MAVNKMYNFTGQPKTNSLNKAEHETLMAYLKKQRCPLHAMVSFLLASNDETDVRIGKKLYKENENYFNAGGFRVCLN